MEVRTLVRRAFSASPRTNTLTCGLNSPRYHAPRHPLPSHDSIFTFLRFLLPSRSSASSSRSLFLPSLSPGPGLPIRRTTSGLHQQNGSLSARCLLYPVSSLQLSSPADACCCRRRLSALHGVARRTAPACDQIGHHMLSASHIHNHPTAPCSHPSLSGETQRQVRQSERWL